MQREKPMGDRGLAWMAALGLGAGLMYMLDPESGPRRRSLARDKVVHALNKTEEAIETTARDLSNRTRGIAARARSRLRSEPLPDRVIEERVRAKMGRIVSHPGAIEVEANRGVVALRGPILARDVAQLLERVSAMPEVVGVENHLEVHETPGDVPALQGPPARRESQFEFRQENWSPTARLVAGTTGGALTYFGLKRRDLPGALMGLMGLGLLARGITNMEMKRLAGIGAGRRAVDIRKTINVNAPVEEVYRYWRNYTNFPRFMAHVKEVRDRGDGRSHWTAAGPAGVPVEWDAVITKDETDRVLAWKSVEGSPIENAGIVQFQPNPQGGTRVDVRMSYNPPAGAMGHVVASLLGSNPKQAMDEDLMRFKSLIETGKTTAESQQVTREKVTR